MYLYVARRLLATIPVLGVVALVVFGSLVIMGSLDAMLPAHP